MIFTWMVVHDELIIVSPPTITRQESALRWGTAVGLLVAKYDYE